MSHDQASRLFLAVKVGVAVLVTVCLAALFLNAYESALARQSFRNRLATLSVQYKARGDQITNLGQKPVGAPAQQIVNSNPGPSATVTTVQVPVVGPLGPKGDKGDPGVTPLCQLTLAQCQGIAGVMGAAGAKGETGKDGPSGVAGVAGLNGKDGPGGLAGKDGQPGANGTNGQPGQPGQPGTPGSPGATGPYPASYTLADGETCTETGANTGRYTCAFPPPPPTMITLP